MSNAVDKSLNVGRKSDISFNLDDFLPYKLVRTAELVSENLEKSYKGEFGLSRPEWRVLANLGTHGMLISRQLVEMTNLDKVKVSRTLTAMEQKGLIERHKAEKDQRSAAIVLSEDGLALYERVVPRALEWEADILDSLSGTHYRDLIKALEALQRHAQEMHTSK